MRTLPNYLSDTRCPLTAPILTHWVLDAQLVMETDASDYALAAILFIMTKDSEIHPIAFHSRTFSALELNYDVHDKELLEYLKPSKSGDTI